MNRIQVELLDMTVFVDPANFPGEISLQCFPVPIIGSETRNKLNDRMSQKKFRGEEMFALIGGSKIILVTYFTKNISILAFDVYKISLTLQEVWKS